MRYLIMILLTAMLGTAQAGERQPAFDLLAGSEWQVVTIAELSAENQPYLQFRSGGEVAGRTGVNSFGGTYTLNGTSLSFGPLKLTRMAGPPSLMEQESRLVESLAAVDGFQREGIRLTLLAGEKPVMSLRQTDWD